ncbi:MAG: LemA family protein [Lachnospiraceae bacterium]|nr:LemA family protein [Lachnospiraceae bacterium]MBQ8165621.1 LemA family protein [Lachnospiraceae bacterium]
MTAVYVILGIVVVLVLWYIGTSNSIKTLDLKVQEGNSSIEVALEKRYDVLTKMLDVVKGYQKHEKEVLSEVISLRRGMSMNEMNQANRTMDAAFGKISLLAEAYPELKSSNNFVQLQAAIMDVEEHLQAARRLYNSNVNAYNAKIVVFPNSIVAGAMGAVQKPFFEASEGKRADVKMSF